MLELKVGDRVKTKLVHHRCEMCKNSTKSCNPFYKSWVVRTVSNTYIYLIHAHEGVPKQLGPHFVIAGVDGIRYTTSTLVNRLGEGMGDHLNHKIYKVNGKYIE